MFSHPFIFLEKSSGKASKSGSFRERRWTWPVLGNQTIDYTPFLWSHTRETKAHTVGNIDSILHHFGSHLQCGPECTHPLVKEANGRPASRAGHWEYDHSHATSDGYAATDMRGQNEPLKMASPRKERLRWRGWLLKAARRSSSKSQGIYLHVWNALNPKGKV